MQDIVISQTECSIGEKKIDQVTEINLHMAAGEVPEAVVYVSEMPNVDLLGDALFDFTPETVQEAIIVLQNELRKRGELYKSFEASICSLLKERLLADQFTCDLPGAILDRIIGDEEPEGEK